MDLQFRARNYDAERHAHALPCARATDHPLSLSTESSSPHQQVGIRYHQIEEFFDPLRGPSAHDLEDARPAIMVTETTAQHTSKEWTSFKRFLMQKFPVSKMISISSASDGIVRSGKALEKAYSHTHMEELDEPEKLADESIKSISRHEYVSQLNDLKEKIVQAWDSDDRVTSLKLTIKVAKLLMDTSVAQFYPTLFVLATDIMDMLGDLVWRRIKEKAELSEDGAQLCSLPVNFKASDVCFDAKETCNNWFCKLGSIRELLPRIYLELALLPCWRFLLDKPVDCLLRLVKMVRGVADPLASSYCRLYMAHCARKLPSHGIGYLVMSINDSNQLLVHTMLVKNNVHKAFKDDTRLLVSLMEPTMEYLMQCILDDASRKKFDKLLVELGLGRKEDGRNIPSVSIFLHQVLKKLPADIVSSRAMDMIDFIEGCSDTILDQCSNYRLLGLRLSEGTTPMDINDVVYRVIQIASQRDRLDEYLRVVEAYVDIVLQNHMDIHLANILEGISNRASNKAIAEEELATLQSILSKLLLHFEDLEEMFALDRFLEIIDMMYGTSRNIININILNTAIRKGFVCDSTTIGFLVEICQALNDSMDPANVREDDLHPARLISRFINMVNFGSDTERQFAFLVKCRGAFGSTNEIKETLVHSSNSLAIRAMNDAKRDLDLIKSCVAFSEVTIPSISAPLKQLNLYLETAEVALMRSLVSHSEGLIDSAINCIESLDSLDGSQKAVEVEAILSSLTKMCGLLVMVPGNSKRGITYFPKRLVTLVDSLSWMTLRMRKKIYCATLSLSATLSQMALPYYADNPMVPGNDLLYFGDSPYLDELVVFSEAVIKKLVEAIGQEPSIVARGSMALETCNSIAFSFKVNPKLSSICSELLEAAKLCLGRNDNYVNSTIRFIGTQSSTS